MTFIKGFWLIITAFVACLSGPLNPGVVLVFSLLVFIVTIKDYYVQANKNNFFAKIWTGIRMIPWNYWFYFVPIGVLSLYSIYIGTYNSTTIASKLPLNELYSKLPYGLYCLFTKKLGFPVLFIFPLINALIISMKYANPEGDKILKTFKWIGMFTLIYLLLLPLGGYRAYRSNILRYDTVMPITLCLIFIFGSIWNIVGNRI